MGFVHYLLIDDALIFIVVIILTPPPRYYYIHTHFHGYFKLGSQGVAYISRYLISPVISQVVLSL